MIADISHHNGKINWAVAGKLIEKVFIKATEGVSYTDPQFSRNANAAPVYKIDAGYYHFATLTSDDVAKDAMEEARHFIDVISKVPKSKLPLVLDLEENKGVILKKKVEMFVVVFFDFLQSQGYEDVMLYSCTPFLNSNLPPNHTLGRYPLWLADYNDPYAVPRGWDKITLHQYTDKGRVNGVYSNVDLNRYIP